MAAALPLAALIPAVHVDAAELRLPRPFLVGAFCAAVLGVLLLGVDRADGGGGVHAAVELFLGRALAGAGAYAVFAIGARVSTRGGGRADPGLAALTGLALGLRFGYLALCIACVAAAPGSLGRPAQPLPFGPALLFGYAVAAGTAMAGGLYG
jgi:prepilin signal peptidase PulO-like enzyme (type II secretory pathway)